MAAGRVNYGSWFFRVLEWDGLLPVFIALIPTVIGFLIPNNRGVIEITGVLLPIAGFFIRFVIGARHIRSNQCAITVRRLQVCFFLLGILLLVFIDALLILSHLMPEGTFKRTDYFVFAIIISMYLASMTIAMYPGRVNSLDDTAWPDDAFGDQKL